MPELPEVETVRCGLADMLLGKTIGTVDYDAAKSFPNAQADVKTFMIGSSIRGVRRRGKILMIDLTSGYSLVIHLKMTGQLVYRSTDEKKRFGAGHPNDSLIGPLPDKTTRVRIGVTGGSLFFNDQRKFGWMRLLPTSGLPNIDFMQKLGPEPLSSNFTSDILVSRLQKRKNAVIKAALLDQTVVAGVGNIYADESLWGAKIHPATRVRDVGIEQIHTLCSELLVVLRLAIEKGGSTDKNYVNAEGKKGSYMSFARVFRREGQPCPRCGTTIIKMRVAGRGTHVCPRCQIEK